MKVLHSWLSEFWDQPVTPEQVAASTLSTSWRSAMGHLSRVGNMVTMAPVASAIWEKREEPSGEESKAAGGLEERVRKKRYFQRERM